MRMHHQLSQLQDAGCLERATSSKGFLSRLPSGCHRPQRYLAGTVGLVASILLAVAWSPVALAHDIAGEMQEAADRFVKSLDQQQKQAALIAWDSEKRFAWHYFPSSMMEARGGRRGLAIKHMAPDQRLGARLAQYGVEPSR